ncbi:MAG: non-canonical purine NTP pyrophosphatase [Verrucomicrobia bacterium]|nr:non-canonical purine NTP pyrophosphatase [Verrucomicrobiota bacterium]
MRCTFVCNIVIKVESVVHVYQGKTRGTIVSPRGDCFGFGKYFLLDGTDKTLGEYMDPEYNARSLAIRNFKEKKPFTTLPMLAVWNGAFQRKDFV